MWFDTIIIAIFLLSGLANLFLGIYVYRKNSENKVNKAFFVLAANLAVWCFLNFITIITDSLFLLRAIYAVASMIPISEIFFVYALINKKPKKWISAALLIIGFLTFVIIFFTPLLIQGLLKQGNFSHGIDFGPILNIWGAILIFLILVSLYIPFRALWNIDEQRKKQISYFLAGEVVLALWGGSISIILPFLGFADFSFLASPGTVLFLGIISYAIIKYNLMNLSSLFFHAFVYSLAVVLIVAFLLALMSISSFFLQHSMVWVVYIIVGLVSVALFFIGRLFFMEKKDLEKAKINLTELLKKAEFNRAKAEFERDKTATIVSSFSDGLIILDEKDRILSVNPRAEQMLEMNAKKVLNKHFGFMSDFPRAKLVDSVLEPSPKNISQKQVELAKDFVVELSVIPLDLDKRDIGHLIVLHDVSREKMVDRMKTEFVSLAAHQLRTPLSIIKWSMSMLKKGDLGRLSKKQGDIVQSTFKNNERLISLVDDLLNITRIEEGRFLYKVALGDMTEVVASAIDTLKGQAQKRKISIEFKEPSDFPKTMIDAEKIKSVAQNLIDNAIKYSPNGGKIIISLRSDGKNIELKVQDFGLGIPKDQHDKIFTKFFRGDNALRVHTTGTGLGLFLSQNIIEAHGGKIWFESRENKGTSFYFSLPIKLK